MFLLAGFQTVVCYFFWLRPKSVNHVLRNWFQNRVYKCDSICCEFPFFLSESLHFIGPPSPAFVWVSEWVFVCKQWTFIKTAMFKDLNLSWRNKVRHLYVSMLWFFYRTTNSKKLYTLWKILLLHSFKSLQNNSSEKKIIIFLLFLIF